MIVDDEKVVQLPKRKKPDADGPLSIVHSYGGCQHAHTEVDEKKSEVTCRDCGEKLNPIWVLVRIANEDRILRDRWAGMRAELKLMSGRVRTKCQHCGEMTRIRSRASSADIRALAEQMKAEDA
ncbi:hypothetical protein PQS31_01705 [Luteimonas sp BLCC-B24]|uniref:hypothetical protein n=1 Tax=Luteimonas sp. BLCC-B24 TaxID=3025317 RepID=UPI00234D3D12|nr:hypothetical protein [Luteimonas sp. BLCC-B24]MDC7805546.1 hypothetical protein [Luteimonas sp. BLCC-B24]